MEIQPNSTKPTAKTSVDKELSDRQLMFIDFTAVSGLMTDDDGELKPMKVGEFAEKIGVERTTLHYWKKSIPDFWGKVRERRMTIGSQARTNKVISGLYLRAARGDAEQVKIWLGIFDGWQPPMQRQTVELGDSWAALLANKRKSAIEGEVVDATANNPETNA